MSRTVSTRPQTQEPETDPASERFQALKTRHKDDVSREQRKSELMSRAVGLAPRRTAEPLDRA